MTSPDAIPRLEQALAHEQFVRAVARGVLGGDGEVEDVLQETFLAAWQKGPRQPGALRSWLGTVARRLALDRRRSSGRRETREAIAARPEALPSPAEIAVREETRRRLVSAVLALEEPYRTTLLWRYYSGLSLSEIAARQGVPSDTVRTRVQRGLTQLRQRLDAQHGGDRRAWGLALVPLVQGHAGTVTTAVVTGIVMKKVVAVVAALLLVAVGGALAIGSFFSPSSSPARPGSELASAMEPVGDPIASPTPADSPESLAPAPGVPARAVAEAAPPFTGTVVDIASKPLSGVTIEVLRFFKDAEGRELRLVDDQPFVTMKTDDQGRFAFDVPEIVASFAAPLGSAEMRVAAEGCPIQVALVARGIPQHVVLGTGGRLVLRVVREDGRPVPDATVLLCAGEAELPSGADQPRAYVHSSTDERGSCEFRLVSPGPYRVRAMAAGLRPVDSELLRLMEEATTECTIHLDPGIVVELRVVTGPQNEPVSGARIKLLGPLGSNGSGTSDTDGRCRIPGIAVSTPGHDSLRQPLSEVLLHQVEADGFVTVRGRRTLPSAVMNLPLEVRMDRGVRIRVRVVDAIGAAVPDPSVHWIERFEGPWQYEAIAVLKPTTDGWLELPRVGPGHRLAQVSSTTGTAYEGRSLEVDVGSEDRDITVTLDRLDGALTGRVLHTDGTPAKVSQIAFIPEGATGEAHYFGRAAILDGEGRFHLEAIRVGQGEVIVQVPGRPGHRFPVVVKMPQESVTLTLPAAMPITGRLVDRDGAGLANTTVVLTRNIEAERQGRYVFQVSEAQVQSDVEGRFRFLADEGDSLSIGLTSGEWIPMQGNPRTVKAGMEGVVLRCKPVGEGGGLPLRLRITSGGLPYDGKAELSWGDVRLRHIAFEFPPDGHQGRHFGIMGPQGTYDFTIHAPAHHPTRLTGIELAEIAAGKTLDVALDRGAIVRLRVRDSEGRLLARASVTINGDPPLLTDEAGEVDATGWNDGGKFRFPLSLTSDPEFTVAQVRGARAPATVDVTLRRLGFVKVRLGVLGTALDADVMLRLLDEAGHTIDEKRIEAAGYRGWTGEVLGELSTPVEGTFLVIAELGARRGEAKVVARPGQRVETVVVWK